MKILNFICLFIISFTLYANDKLPPLEITEIQSGVYLHKSYNDVKGFGLVSSNGLIIIEDDKAFIVDTPWSTKDTAILVDWIKDKNYQLLGSVSTHSHEDRAAGIHWLNRQEIPTYASSLTNEILTKAGKAIANNTIQDVNAVLADGMMTTFYPGAGHAVDNIIVWLPKLKILFGGCLVKSMASKSLGYTGEAYLDKWSDSVTILQQKYSDAMLVVPGHGKPGDLKLLAHTKKLVKRSLKKTLTN